MVVTKKAWNDHSSCTDNETGLYAVSQMVRSGEGLQRARDGPARSLPRGPLHLLRPAVHNEDRPYASRPG